MPIGLHRGKTEERISPLFLCVRRLSGLLWVATPTIQTMSEHPLHEFLHISVPGTAREQLVHVLVGKAGVFI